MDENDCALHSLLQALQRINDNLIADIDRIRDELEKERGLYERRAEAPAKGGREESAGGRQR